MPPHILERIIDGAVPTPEEIDLIHGYFKGEFFLTSTCSGWERKTPVAHDPLPLPQGAEHLPGPEITYPLFAAPPNLKPGPKPTGNGAPPNSEAYTGSGLRVR